MKEAEGYSLLGNDMANCDSRLYLYECTFLDLLSRNSGPGWPGQVFQRYIFCIQYTIYHLLFCLTVFRM